MHPRRPISSVIKKAPSKLWQQHRKNLAATSANSDTDSQLALDRRTHLKRMTNPHFHVVPIRKTVVPLFAPNTSSSSSSSSAFNYTANGFVFPLYKPPHVNMAQMETFLDDNLASSATSASAAAAISASPFDAAVSVEMSKYFKQQNQRRNQSTANLYQKIAGACELPFSLALSWAQYDKWNYEFCLSLSSDVSGVVPVVFSSPLNAPPPEHIPRVTRATYEAVLEGHVPRSCVAASAAGTQFSPSTELNFATIVRHGYYLQEPVTVVRWQITGEGCEAVSPQTCVLPMFSSSSRVVGEPNSPMTHKLDVPCTMIVLRGVSLGSGGSADKNTERVFALSQSPYASEEMIAPTPNSAPMALRNARLMDGMFTP